MAPGSGSCDHPTMRTLHRRPRPAAGPARRARSLIAAAVVLAVAVGLPSTAGAVSPSPTAFDPGKVSLRLSLLARGLSQPVLLTGARDGTNRKFIVEKGGRIRIVKGSPPVLLATPFLDLSAKVSKGGEQGLLGLAFHPSYKTNGRFYVNYTDTAGDTVVAEYRRSSTSPDRAATTGRTLLRIDQPYANHNGGMIAFGPDGYLYIGMGDGGSAGDPGNRAQSLESYLGKMLRIDVDGRTGTLPYGIPATNPYVGKAGLDLIWSRGLRNPWRWSFDRQTGDLWIGDVGQASWEEVDRSVKGSAVAAGRAANYGWRVMEGRHCYAPATGCSTTGKVLPLVEYAHAGGRCSVTGGYVYRGTAYPDMVGGYFFADYCTGEIFSVAATAASPASLRRLLDTSLRIGGFGQDDAGYLYVTDLAGGTVYQLRDG
jgi:glucose/arabinose dehydrogenase